MSLPFPPDSLGSAGRPKRGPDGRVTRARLGDGPRDSNTSNRWSILPASPAFDPFTKCRESYVVFDRGIRMGMTETPLLRAESGNKGPSRRTRNRRARPKARTGGRLRINTLDRVRSLNDLRRNARLSTDASPGRKAA